MELTSNFQTITLFLGQGIVRDSICNIFQDVLMAGKQQHFRSVSGLVSRNLREMRQLHSYERRLVSDTLYDLIRKLRRLCVLSGLKYPSAEQIYYSWIFDQWIRPFSMKDPISFQKNESFLRKEFSQYHLSIHQMFEHVLRWEQLSQKAELEKDRKGQVDILSETLSYPSWMVEKFIENYGFSRTKELLESQNQRAPLTIRVNACKGTRDVVATQLAAEGITVKETTCSPWGFILQTSQNVYGLSSFKQGLFEIQDEGSQLIAELVAPPPSAIVIDACAGAGGKTLALGALMGNKGRLISLDIEKEKLEELQKRVRRAGLTNVQAIHIQTGIPLSLQKAHRVLCDVPCSGLGVLRRNPESRWAVQKQDIDELTQKQRAILEQYASLVLENGRLIYSTCTLLPEENELMIQGFLQDHPEFILMPVKEIWGTLRANQVGDGTYLRTFPDQLEGPDGFFAAVLRKIGVSERE